MKAIETTATLDETGQLTLDRSLDVSKPQRVRVIVLISEDEEPDPDETPTEVAIAGIRQGLREALSGQTIPLSEMWEGIDVD
jgi:hypothetical protein